MNRSEVENPVLIGQAGPLNGQRWTIQHTLTIGRDPTCDVVIIDRQVSRYHARLTASPEGILLEDLGSKNGTYLNGARIDDAVLLSDGDQVHVAMMQMFVYLSSDATMPLEPVASVPPAVVPQVERPGTLFVDNRSHRVWVGQKELLPPLSVPQFKLLQVLYERHGDVVPRQELVVAIWGEMESQGVSEQAFDALVRRLRERLNQVDPNHPYILTVRGHGLRLEIPQG